MHDAFRQLARAVSNLVGTSGAFVLAMQNRDSKAIHLKLDELLRAVKEARTRLVDLEDLPDDELARLETEFKKLRMEARS